MGGDRKIGVALDFSASSKMALQWAVDNLLDRGDTLVVLNAIHGKADEPKHALWAKSGSRKLKLNPIQFSISANF